VIPIAATSAAISPALASASRARHQLSIPDLIRVVLDPAGFRKDLPKLLLGNRTNRSIVIEKQSRASS
jgi:hypothetical protein